MEYNFNKRTGKSFSQMIQLKINIEKGLNCAVATLNKEKTQRDFEYMTGVKLILESIDNKSHVYTAKIIKQIKII